MMFDRLRALCAARTDNLAELAEIAAPGDPAFFDGAQFSGADLRATNLTGFRLHGAALEGPKSTKRPSCQTRRRYSTSNEVTRTPRLPFMLSTAFRRPFRKR